MKNFIKILSLILFTEGAGVATAQAHVISDQGLLRIYAERAICRDRQTCLDMEYMPATQRVMTIDEVIEQDGHRSKGGKAPEILLIIPTPARGIQDPHADDGPAVF